MQAERDLNNATDMRGDYEAALPYFSEDFVSIDDDGKVSNRDAALSWVKAGLYKGESTTYDDVKIRVYGDGNTAIMTAIVHFKGLWEGKPLDLRQRFTNTWVKQGGRWQIVSQHSSNL
jgi:ketosteroid isomerase-like protein